MKNNDNNWMKLIWEYDEDFKFSDYTLEELEEMKNEWMADSESFKNKYFGFYNDVKSSSLKKQDW